MCISNVTFQLARIGSRLQKLFSSQRKRKKIFFSSLGWHSLQLPLQMWTGLKTNKDKPSRKHRQGPIESNEQGIAYSK